ncbi:MAG: hypothetical protein QM756_15090 [Polyangiaceae bacterium]
MRRATADQQPASDMQWIVQGDLAAIEQWRFDFSAAGVHRLRFLTQPRQTQVQAGLAAVLNLNSTDLISKQHHDQNVIRSPV